MIKRMVGMAVLGVAALCLWAAAAAAYDPGSPSWTKKKVGTAVDFFWFQSVEGEAIKPPTAERTVLVHVWATWCAPCVTELPSFDQFAERLADRGVAVVTLSVDRGGPKAVKPFMEKHRSFAHSLVLLDPDYLSGDLWGIHTLPTTILIKDGREVARLVGRGDWKGDEGEELEALLSQQPNAR